MKKKIINGNDVIVSCNPNSSRFIRLDRKNKPIEDSVIQEAVNDVEIEMVKIIGNLIGTKDKIEMVMDKEVFFEWVEKIHNMEEKKFKSWIGKT